MRNRKRERFELTPESKGGKIVTVVLLILAIILLIAVSFLLVINFGYFPYFNINEKPVELNVTINNIPQLKNSSFGEIVQFYPNMKFNHNNLSYWIDANCNEDKRERMIMAFKLFSNELGLVNFSEESGGKEIDIEVSCSQDEKYNPSNSNDEKEFFIAGEGGAREIISTGRYNVINKGIILLYGNPQNSIECDWPNTEVHELVHVFGFNHSLDKKSLMYPYLESCTQKLDNSIIEELRKIYSEENLPDLYLENASAVNTGRYLNFNMTIKNSGDRNAIGVSYSVLDDSKVVETKELKDIDYGGGIILGVSNLKLINSDSREIKIILDYFNKIDEIDEKNNVAVFSYQ